MAQRRAVTKANATRYKPADKARTGPRCLPPRDLAWSASADGPFPPNKACPNLTLRAPLSVHVFRTVRQPRRVAHPPPTAPTDRSGQQNTYLLCITCVFARPSEFRRYDRRRYSCRRISKLPSVPDDVLARIKSADRWDARALGPYAAGTFGAAALPLARASMPSHR